MCMDGPCDSAVILERDGRVHSAAKPPNDLGACRADAYAALDAAIRTTDFAAMRAKPFTGECPIAFDGQKQIFEFSVGSGDAAARLVRVGARLELAAVHRDGRGARGVDPGAAVLRVRTP